MLDVVQGLWIGPKLSKMEQTCIASFLHHGHGFRLYVYEDVQEVPDGTEIADADTILPRNMVFAYPKYDSIPEQEGSYAGFADFFRHKLLLDKGGWWVDMDLICVKPFDFPSEYVFSSGEAYPHQRFLDRGERYRANAGALKAPPGSPAFKFTWGECQKTDTATIPWGKVGPNLVVKAIIEYGLQSYVQAPHVFCPVHGNDWKKVLDPSTVWDFPEEPHAIHLWNELWRREGLDKDAEYPAGCLFEQLKRQYL